MSIVIYQVPGQSGGDYFDNLPFAACTRASCRIPSLDDILSNDDREMEILGATPGEKMKLVVLALMPLLFLACCGCSERRISEPLVIHVLRDPAASELDSALVAIGARQLRTSRGQPIMIATIETTSYTEGLQVLGVQYHPELVVFNSVEDIKKSKIDIWQESAVRSPVKIYYVAIPSWASNEERKAAEGVLTNLRQELQKTYEPRNVLGH